MTKYKDNTAAAEGIASLETTRDMEREYSLVRMVMRKGVFDGMKVCADKTRKGVPGAGAKKH